MIDEEASDEAISFLTEALEGGNYNGKANVRKV
jgi:hypothetical protein